MISLQNKFKLIKILLIFIFFISITIFFKPSTESSYKPDTKIKLANIQKEINSILNKGAILSTLTQGWVGRWFIVSLDMKYTSYEVIKERLILHGFVEVKPNIFCRDGESMEILIDTAHNEKSGTLYWLYPDANCIKNMQ
ncbi:MAG: hypothetical protein Q4G28_01920 [Neisseria sp.]|nr:hypothetical protein [Neisseria sp.]